MKNASLILSHLSSLPQFRLLKPQACYQKYISCLSQKWQKAIAFVYIKNEILYIAITHPGFKQELNYMKDSLRSVLRDLNKYDLNCKSMIANKVIIFHSKYHAIPEEKSEPKTVPYYQEQAQGVFEMPKDEKLKDAFQRIQDMIQCES
ncbi:hypothetical protein MNB_SV-13-152 [hydrothermal vent metagenome]|uniref:DUF721 domain-containing protein n=1 Tax=hydrothermal vent metagenome TaxID=652676 RepID=A0A1W1C050_9ZZZZ